MGSVTAAPCVGMTDLGQGLANAYGAYDTYRNKDGWWNDEAQYYADSRAENARVENGNLIIQARKDGEQLTGFADYGGQDYSSARLFTKGKASWQYGYFEMRAKIWTPDAITVAIDGKPYFRYKNDGKGEGSWPFDTPHHIIMNIAVGGSWGGREGIDEEAFPARMEVDYVRVWQAGV